jgi:hypothetical protein
MKIMTREEKENAAQTWVYNNGCSHLLDGNALAFADLTAQKAWLAGFNRGYTDGYNQCTGETAAAINELKKEMEELQSTFDLQWKATLRGIQMWRAAHPGKEHVWPDHADLVVWLMEQLQPNDSK